MEIRTEEQLNNRLATPSEALIQALSKLDGDLMILGAGGKMGPTLAVLAQRALKAAGKANRVIAVSRFTDPLVRGLLTEQGVEMLSVDLLEDGAVEALPRCPNLIYMLGRKFGTSGQEALTWQINTALPARVASHFRQSRIVAFSSGNLYPMLPALSGGATEETPADPRGEYAMSCLGRERVFEYGSERWGTPVLLYRLNYAVDLRYGVLYDMAQRILAGESVPVDTGVFNCIWQGDANEIALRSLFLAESPAKKLNVTGPETVSVRWAASCLAQRLGKPVSFSGQEQERALLSNASACAECFGYPRVSLRQMLDWQADWLLSGGRGLGKPTHFEERTGKF